MDLNLSNKLLVIASGTIAVSGLILLLVSIFGETKDNWALNFALMSLLLSNLFNLIRIQRNRRNIEKGKDSQEEQRYV